MTDINPQAALFGALAKAQAEMKNAPLNKTNPFFKSKYADLAAIRDAVTPALAKYDLCVFQSQTMIDGQPVSVTTIAHKEGGFIQSETPIYSNKHEPQLYGSALTYARRYGLAALCNISAEDDDDANMAQTANKKLLDQDQIYEIATLIKQRDCDIKAMFTHLGVKTVSEIPSSRFAQLKKQLEDKPLKAAE